MPNAPSPTVLKATKSKSGNRWLRILTGKGKGKKTVDEEAEDDMATEEMAQPEEITDEEWRWV